MKKVLLFLSVLSLLSLSGCDMFRRLAGRPTAKELEQLKVEALKRQEAVHMARIDSLKKVEKTLSDSIAVLDGEQAKHYSML